MNVSLSPRAALDLEEIGDYIARDNPIRAVTFVEELRSVCARIGAHPQIHPVQKRIDPSIRRAVHGRYLIFYRTAQDVVVIERVLHSARSIDVQFFG